MSFDFYAYIGLPLIIIFARILDVSLGTMRIILISKGLKRFAPVIGFFEVLIWIMVVKQIITDVSSPVAYFAYAFGYALGTYIGIFIEEKLSLGTVMIRIIAIDENNFLESLLRAQKLGITKINAMGKNGTVKILITILNRKDLQYILDLIKNHDPHIFYTIEDVHTVNKGFFANSYTENSTKNRVLKIFNFNKKSK